MADGTTWDSSWSVLYILNQCWHRISSCLSGEHEQPAMMKYKGIRRRTDVKESIPGIGVEKQPTYPPLCGHFCGRLVYNSQCDVENCLVRVDNRFGEDEECFSLLPSYSWHPLPQHL